VTADEGDGAGVTPSGERRTSRLSDARRQLERGKARVEQLLVWCIWERMLEVEFIDRSVALAAKAFVSFFPLVIVVAAFLPPGLRASVFGTITRRLGMSGASLSMARGAFATSKEVRRATGVLGLVLTFFYVSSFTAALQRVYLRAWRRPAGGGVLGYVRGALWFVGVIAYLALIGGARDLIGGARDLIGSGPAIAVFIVVALAAASALWWLTGYTMLRREVRLRVLLPGGFITGILMSGFAISASVWMPRTLERNTSQFGIFGVALALVTWFSGAAICIVIGACCGPPLAEDTGPVGRWIRGAPGTVLTPGAPANLPAPDRTYRLVDAVRRRDDG
jgi:membrane protein